MRLLDRLRALVMGKPRRISLPEEIERCKNAMLHRNVRITELWRSVDYPGQDEHSAALGGVHGEYHALRQKQERAGAWLCILLLKRGRVDDLRLAEAIKMAAWP